MKNFLSQEELSIIVEHKDVRQLEIVLDRVILYAVEEALKQLPSIATRLVKNMAAVNNMTQDFIKKNNYQDNLPVVQEVIMQVEAENPGKDYDQILALSRVKIDDILANVKKVEDKLPFTIDGVKA